MPWFALKVRLRNEGAVHRALTRKAYETFLPTYTDLRRYSDRIKKVDAPLFPGYLFCRIDPVQRLPVLTTAGVEYIVSLNGEPEPVPEHEVAAIERITRNGAAAKPWPYLQAGHRVRVECGAFAGLEGILTGERGDERLVISVTLLQRSVAVEIDRTWIRPL